MTDEEIKEAKKKSLKKSEFDTELSNRLGKLSPEERQSTLDYYDELFNDRKEAGDKETDIIKSFGTPQEIAERILNDESLYTKTSRKVKSRIARTTNNAKSTIAKIFTNKSFLIFYFSAFFITIPLTISFVAIIFSLFVGALSVALGVGITIVAVIFSFAVVAFSCIVAGPLYAIIGLITAGGFTPAGMAILGSGLALTAVGLLFVMLLRFVNYLRIFLFVKRENKPRKYKKAYFSKTAIIVLVSVMCGLLVTGGVFFTTGFARTDWDIKKLDTATYEYVGFNFTAEEIDNITIKTRSRDVEIIAVTEDFRITAYSDDQTKLTITLDGGTLTVTEGKFKFNFAQIFNTFSSVNWRKQQIKIYVPIELEDINVDNSSGDFKITGVSAQNLATDITSGGTTINNCYIVNTLSIKTTSGDTKVNSCTVNNVTIKTTSGDARVLNSNIVGNLAIDTTSGDAKVQNCHIGGHLSASMTSGDVRIKETATKSMYLKTTSGDIDAQLIGSDQNYDIRSSVRSGTNRVGNRNDTAAAERGNTIDVRATSGDIKLRFIPAA